MARVMRKSSENLLKKPAFFLLSMVALIFFIFIMSNNKSTAPQSNTVNIDRESCLADECLDVENLEYPAGALPPEVQDALMQALQDEYKALRTYEAVIAQYGQVRPFSMIKGSEEQHIAALKSLFDKYGMTVPPNTYDAQSSVPSSLTESCQLGVDAEIANASLYQDKLLPVVSGYEDITLVFTNLMNASQQRHLRAFERCN